MSEQYTHLLIPENSAFVPEPRRVQSFLCGMVDPGSAPDRATLKVGTPSRSPRVGTDPITGERISIPTRNFRALEGPGSVARDISSLDDYDLRFVGEGPVKVQPFVLYATTQSQEIEFKGTFGYEIACRLRSEAVSLCGGDFGRACGSEARSAEFQHPMREAKVIVANTGCAHFWSEFRFGKWLYPKIDETLDLIQPEIMAKAMEAFEIKFAQGCNWG